MKQIKNIFLGGESPGLKGKKITIRKSLMVTRMKKVSEARERHNFKNVGTSNGKILYKYSSEKLRHVIVNTIYWLTDMFLVRRKNSFFLFSFSVFGSGLLFIK